MRARPGPTTANYRRVGERAPCAALTRRSAGRPSIHIFLTPALHYCQCAGSFVGALKITRDARVRSVVALLLSSQFMRRSQHDDVTRRGGTRRNRDSRPRQQGRKQQLTAALLSALTSAARNAVYKKMRTTRRKKKNWSSLSGFALLNAHLAPLATRRPSNPRHQLRASDASRDDENGAATRAQRRHLYRRRARLRNTLYGSSARVCRA